MSAFDSPQLNMRPDNDLRVSNSKGHPLLPIIRLLTLVLWLHCFGLLATNAFGQSNLDRKKELRSWEIRSARPWMLTDGTIISAKTIAANDYVALLETGSIYGPFTGRLLLRTSHAGDDDRQFIGRLRKEATKLEGTLPGDDASEASEDREVAISLTQISLTLLCDLEMHRQFPERVLHADDGTPLLSWRVKMLPYLGEEKLYKEFHLDEPWDSEHNRKLIENIPPAYYAGEKPVGGVTRFLAPIGEGTLWEDGGGYQIRRVADGTAYAIAVVYSAPERAVFWTKPDDFEVDPQDCRLGLKQEGASGYFVGFIDGHYAQLPPETKESTLRGYLTIRGREQLPLAGSLLPAIPRRRGP